MRCAAARDPRLDCLHSDPETGIGTSSAAILSAEWVREGDRLEFWIEAESFLRHMNRVLVGTMIEVAKGEMSLEQFAELLEGRPRLDAGPRLRRADWRLIGVGYGTRLFS